MRAIVLIGYGGPEKLVLRELPDPEPGPGQVRVAVRYAGINFADILCRMGLYDLAPRPPMTPGMEASGVIDAAGPGTTLRPGQRVIAVPGVRFGTYAEKLVVPEREALPLADDMPFQEAAGFAVTYLTAYEMIVRVAHLAAGEKILIHAAAGGVGTAAVQIARRLGAVIFGTASAAKHAVLREHGAQHLVDYRTADFEKEIEAIAGPRAMDVVLDPLGGKDTRKSYRLLASGGRLVVFGFSRVVRGWKRGLGIVPEVLAMPRFSPLQLIRDNVSVAGVHLGRMTDTARLRENAAALISMYREGAIRPLIGRVFPLSEAAEAHRFIQRRENIGKVLLEAGQGARC